MPNRWRASVCHGPEHGQTVGGTGFEAVGGLEAMTGRGVEAAGGLEAMAGKAPRADSVGEGRPSRHFSTKASISK